MEFLLPDTETKLSPQDNLHKTQMNRTHEVTNSQALKVVMILFLCSGSITLVPDSSHITRHGSIHTITRHAELYLSFFRPQDLSEIVRLMHEVTRAETQGPKAGKGCVCENEG